MALMQEIRQLTHAWVLLHKKQYAQAIPLLTDLLTRASNNHLEDYIIQYAVLLAMAYHMNLNEEEALENIGIALKYAQKEDQIQVFLEQGIEIMDLLYAAAKRGIEPDFAGRVLSRFPQMDKIDHQEKLIHYEDEIIEPLSQRETEILKLISQGLSNQEIALDLHLSLSTVKVHTYNIFRKLNVRSRIQAVSKARLINFLS
jgi:LuxR family maltose regulon positive regulatory protein